MTGDHFVRDERGNAAIGYAIFLGLIVGAIVVGAQFLGNQSRSAFQVVAQHASNSADNAAAAAKSTAPAIAAPSVTPALPSSTKPAWPFDVRLAIQCSALLVGCVLMFVMNRRAQLRDRAKEEEAEANAADDTLSPEAYDSKLYTKRHYILRSLCRETEALAAGKVSVRQLMSTKLTTVGPTASIADVQALMQSHGLRHLLVTDVGRLVGVISDRDLSRPGRKAGDIMARRPLTVSPDTLVSPAVTLMMRKRISCLPVVENDELVGLFTTTDLIMTLQCAFQLLQTAAPYLEQANREQTQAAEHLATAG